ncbi:MAG TPA: hypothetical protein ENN43_00415 [bacterium]|nr:hypothetical protein [bacterium]
MAHTEDRNSYYLRVNEPLKFAAQLEAAAEQASRKGFEGRFDFGGPEQFPTHSFTFAEIKAKRTLIMTDSVAYWTKIGIDVRGRSAEENEKSAEEIASLIAESIEIHRQ